MTRSGARRLLPLLLLLLAVASGCMSCTLPPASLGAQCSPQSGCALGYVCADAVCLPAGLVDAGLPAVDAGGDGGAPITDGGGADAGGATDGGAPVVDGGRQGDGGQPADAGDVVDAAAVNHAPVARADLVVTDTGATVSGALVAGDDDGDPLVYTITSSTQRGAVTQTVPGGAAFTFTPLAGDVGDDQFTFSASDATATSAATVVVQVVDRAAYLVWTGAAGTASWADVANWSAGAPGAATPVYVPVTAHDPILPADVTIAALVVQTGARVDTDLHTLVVTGPVFAGGTFSARSRLEHRAQSTDLAGHLPRTLISGASVLTAGTTVVGDLLVTGNGSVFDVDARDAVVTGALTVENYGILKMTTAGGHLRVDGVATLAGTSTANLVTNGVLEVRADLQQTDVTTSDSLAASGSHVTVLDGDAPQIVRINSPLASRFNDLDVRNPHGVALVTAVAVGRDLTVRAGAALTSDDTLSVRARLSVEPGATLAVDTLELHGAVTVRGTVSAQTIYLGGGTVVPADLPYRDLAVGVSLDLEGTTHVGRDLLIQANGEVNVDGHQLVVDGDLDATADGFLTMTNGGDRVLVRGDVSFSGSGSTNHFTSGALTLHGDFSQLGSPPCDAFSPFGAHRVVFAGDRVADGVQAISFGDPAVSYFQDAEVVAGASVALVTGATVRGTLTVAGDLDLGAGTTLTVSHLVFATGADVTGTGAVVVPAGGTCVDDNVTLLCDRLGAP